MSVTTNFAAGAGLGAGQLNGFLAAWTPYTPTLTNIALGNGSVVARFYQQGKTVLYRINFTPGSTTTYGAGAASISLPVAAYDASEVWTPAMLLVNGSRVPAWQQGSGFLYVVTSGTNVNMVPMTSSTVNPGTTGRFVVEGVYEAA